MCRGDVGGDVDMYTGEPIYFYMIGKNARPNQVLVNENYQLYNSPQKPYWDIMTQAICAAKVVPCIPKDTMSLGHYGTIQIFWDCSIDDHFY